MFRKGDGGMNARLSSGKQASVWLLAAAACTLPWLASCGGAKLHLTYPAESVVFPFGTGGMPAVYLDLVRDLRPVAQRSGRGRFFGITYPADKAWDRPVEDIYREALLQDLNQTQVIELVPMANQADYRLSADILSLGCHLQRSPVSFLLPLAAGMGAGVALGDNSSDKIKTGAAVGLLALIAVPVPASHAAEAEVRLTLRDSAGEIVWERSCLGEVSETLYLPATSRDDQKLVDKYLTRAMKRCNGCLVGQLRQMLLYEDVE
jgi:hypothetical protein